MYRYNTDTFGNKSSSSIQAETIYLAARKLAFREGTRIYGKSVVVYSCNELYSVNNGKFNEAGEFLAWIGVWNDMHQFTGHKIRYSVYKK